MPQKHWLTWFCQNTSVPEVNVWCAVRLLLSSHWGELPRNIVKVLCLLHTVLGVSNKLPHTAVKPDILYPVVIVRSDVLYVPQLSGVKQAAGWSVILVSIWNTKIRESLRLSWSPHTHISTVRSYTQLLLEPHNSNIITVTSLQIQYVTFSYIVPSHNSSLLRCFTL